MKLPELIIRFLKILERKVRGFNYFTIKIFKEEIQNCNSILDLGCGKSSIIERLDKKPEYSMGIDIFKDYIEISRKKQIHDDYLKLNILEVDKEIEIGSFDCVILMDVIEHIKKKDGLDLISKMEKIARKKIVIFTPNGYLRQPKYDKNVYQIHRSAWTPKLFRKLGFTVYGVNGLKYLRGELARIKRQPIELWYYISILSNFLVRYLPRLAFQLLCVKTTS